tara:strand:- start:1 stop:666 length:666 start_codon:yes stop_codon:yes gene_type:complete
MYTGPDIVTDGLVLALDAASARSYSGSGTVWNDLSGSGYTHNLISSPSYTTIDGAICFDMSSGGYAEPVSSTYTFGSNYTYTAWARTISDASATTWRTLWRTTPNDHPILIEDGTDLIGLYDNGGSNFNSFGINVGTIGIVDKWTLFTLVGTAGTTTLYINGTAYTASVSVSITGNSHDAIGAASTSQPFGYVATTTIYNRSLTTAEVTQNYNAQKSRFGL